MLLKFYWTWKAVCLMDKDLLILLLNIHVSSTLFSWNITGHIMSSWESSPMQIFLKYKNIKSSHLQVAVFVANLSE